MAEPSTTPRAGTKNGGAAGYKKSTAREYFESICIAVILALFVRTFVVQAFKIPTGSMENNLLIGDHLLVNKFVFAPTMSGLERTLLPIDPVRRGDILVFKYPQDPERDFIKRVVGLPGDVVEIRRGNVFVNGDRLDEPYLDPREDTRSFAPRTIPDGMLFVMGDNRLVSGDSRFDPPTGVGLVPEDRVIGVAFVRVWPPSRWGWI